VTGALSEKDIGLGKIDAWIGKRLKMRRIMLKMSQDELASMVGVTFQQVQKYESGANRISAGRMYAMSKVLGVEVGFFFDGLDRNFPEFVAMLREQQMDRVEDEAVQFDPMKDDETLRLVNAYWRLRDPAKRGKILEFIVSMTD
jgi:transcriptional regulator with XRE-family HTH domain